MHNSSLPLLMIHIFPNAVKAIIEETIGHKLPTASPPLNQIPKMPKKFVGSNEFYPFASVPSWFDWKKISTYESSIFKNENYLKIRNSILNNYRESGGYLTIESCLGIADFETLLNVFNFLEDFKLINYQVDLKMELINLNNNSNINNTASINISQSDNDFTNDNALKYYADSPTHNKVKKRYVSREFLQNNLCKCGERAELFTSDLYFICNKCYESFNYTNKLLPRNFHKITPKLLRSLWTKKEEYFLLRNIELYGDDWKRVSQDIGKSPEQCIFHFLKMSLIDECKSYPSLCFSSVPNPISTLIAYVSYTIHPNISAELAKTAIKYIDRPNILEILLNCAVNKATEILELEKLKRNRLEKVEIEALIIKIKLKADAIREMYNEVKMVKAELERFREKLIDELNKK